MMLRTIAAVLALALPAGAAAAQPAPGLKEQIVGSWNFVVAEVTAPDGNKSFPFGETPKGILIFTADGRFAQIHVAGDVPRIASNNRLTGTPEEYAEIMRRSLSVFGTWTVDEASKTGHLQHRLRLVPELAGRGADPQHRQAHIGRVRQHQPQRGRRARQREQFLPAGEVVQDGASRRQPPVRG
jgi:hypothetical protein